MRIVSLNAWGGQLWDALAGWIPEIGADILLLQEATRAPEPSPSWLSYRDDWRALAQRADLFGDVAALLPGWQAAFAPAARGPLTDEAGRTYRSEHGLAAFFAPRLAVVAQAQSFIEGAFRVDGWGPEPEPRAIQMFRVLDPERGGPFSRAPLTVAHLHGLRDAAGKQDTPARAAQAERIVAALADFAPPGAPLVLGGDFNLLPESGTFARLGAALGLRDLVTRCGFTDTRTSHYAKPVRFADYMLVTDDVPVAAFDLPAQPEVSDHRPLVLDLDGAEVSRVG